MFVELFNLIFYYKWWNQFQRRIRLCIDIRSFVLIKYDIPNMRSKRKQRERKMEKGSKGMGKGKERQRKRKKEKGGVGERKRGGREREREIIQCDFLNAKGIVNFKIHNSENIGKRKRLYYSVFKTSWHQF